MAVDLRAEPGFDDVLQVTLALRERDRREIFATRWPSDATPEALARDTVATGAFRWGAYLDGRPVAMIGAFPRWPKVWSPWAYGTDDWNKVVLTLTKHVKRFMLPAVRRAGMIRADCLSWDGHTDAQAWLQFLGGKPEYSVDNWGVNGERFTNFVWRGSQAVSPIDNG